MKRIALIVLAIVIVIYVGLILVPVDPVERRPGLGLSGDLAAAQDTDWAFFEGRTQAWLEMHTWYLVPHSITVSAWADDGTLYVGCSRCDTKVWPNHVARDDRVRLKIGDEIYMRRAVRITDSAELQGAMGDREVRPGYALFRLDPR
ncbi:MAG: hypothetical protein OXH52_20095 [Gammaproteobacteria bacterium]|nr:hypothetical protein [Gammaproteobacteria bacterium]